MNFSHLQFIILLSLVLATSTIFVYSFSNNVTDQQALLSVKASITADPFGVLSSWNNSIHFCQWTGVTCSRRRQRVTALRLPSQQLVGKLSLHIGNLSFLRSIYLRENEFQGSIPNEIGRLFRLQNLHLGQNSFQGEIPGNLSHCIDIRKMAMNNNDLVGKLPTEFASWSKLDLFDLGNNHFTGSIPPLDVAHLAKLEDFVLSMNYLSAYNYITEPVPMNLGSLSSLQLLNLGGNQLGDNQLPHELSFFNSLVNCTHLYYLGLFKNGLRGQLPYSIVNLSTTMEILNLFGNHLYGNIPREIGKLVNLTALQLDNNLLTGTIPESIGELSKLGALWLGENNILGVIPTSISNITQLNFLSIHDSMLQGSIPIGLFNISTLQELYLYSNRLNGVIPEQIVGLSSQCFALHLARNLFAGQLPSNIGSLKQLVELDVSNNKLTGDIPDTLGNCVMLEELYMEGNLFQGRIPSSFKDLKSLKILDLSSNNISANIPRFFDGFPLIQFLNLSHNKLGGEVPKEGLFSNVSRFSVVGNLRLCGGIQALKLHACPVKNSRKKKKTFPPRKILLVVLLPLAILLACLVFIFYRQRKSKQMDVPVPVLQDNQYPRISYQDLLLGTNQFSSNNLLGEGRYGSVYKGTLESSEQTVAVKVLNVEARGANKSFLAECETLRNIRHRNLIKIITVCYSTDFKGNDFKALVFEFMTNGSLDNWLHPSPSSYQGNERNLTLLQRLNISIDVALGVDYLHHHSHTSIIHCDIKPSNILLDEEFVARVGDFGLARFSFATTSDINQTQTSSTGVRGTVGYVPPEYGMGGEISAEGDVYSYGILLLEMFSGKRPTGSSILMDNANNLHDYVKKSLPLRVMDIADPRIVLYQEDRGLTANQSYSRANMEACLASVFEVGILCSVETPKERIDISVAIKQLHVARAKLLSRG